MEKITYLDTENYNGWDYAAYLELCEDNGIEAAPEGSAAYYEFLSSILETDRQDFFDNLEYFEENKRPCTITGTLGLWWGRPDIKPVTCETLSDAILQCIENGDIMDYSVTLEDGVVHVAAYHHDGCNNFEIKPVGGTYPKYLF